VCPFAADLLSRVPLRRARGAGEASPDANQRSTFSGGIAKPMSAVSRTTLIIGWNAVGVPGARAARPQFSVRLRMRTTGSPMICPNRVRAFAALILRVIAVIGSPSP
jgi:hypothetical protein